MRLTYRESADVASKTTLMEFVHWLERKFDLPLSLIMTTDYPGKSQITDSSLRSLHVEANCEYDSHRRVGRIMIWIKASECFRAIAHECEHLVRMRNGTHESHNPGSPAELEYDFRIDTVAQRWVNEFAGEEVYEPDNPDLAPSNVEWEDEPDTEENRG